MAGAKQLSDTSFILVPAGAIRPAGVCSRHCIALHRGACRGELQARREKRWFLHVLEVWLRRDANIVVKAESVWVSAHRRPHRGRGTTFSFYRPRGGSLQSCRTVLATYGGMVYSATELTVVLANLASGKASRRVLYPSRSGFEGSGMGASPLVVAQASARGSSWRRAGGRTVADMATSCHPGLPQHRGWCCSARGGGVAAGMAA
jgi:hypothetical protein